MQPRVLVVEDHPAMQAAICNLVSTTCQVVGAVDDGAKVLDAALRLLPDVILLDISLPTLSGLALLPSLRSALPNAKIIVLTVHSDEEYRREALHRGADGYLLKSEIVEMLVPELKKTGLIAC